MEAWRYGSVEVKKGSIELLRKAWTKSNLPEDWKKSIIVPLYKRDNLEDGEL